MLSILYESEITTELTVPTPSIIAKDLKQLLVDWGYELHYKTYGNLSQSQLDLKFQYIGIHKYSMVKQEFFQKTKFTNESHTKRLGRKESKLAADVDIFHKEYFLLYFKFHTRNRFCHITSQPYYEKQYSYLVKGRAVCAIVKVMCLIRESGLLDFWRQIYSLDLKTDAIYKVRSADLKEKSTVVTPLTLKGKIQQVFQIYALGNLVAIVCALVLFSKRRTLSFGELE